jgi:hypothetical protein
MAPCITAIIVALIVSRSRRTKRAKAKAAGEPKKEDTAAQENVEASDGSEELEEETKSAPKKSEPQDPMAPPAED